MATTLKVADRCDRCNAQAHVRTTMGEDLDLLWCGHHFAENELNLLAAGAVVAEDTRQTLTARATADEVC